MKTNYASKIMKRSMLILFLAYLANHVNAQSKSVKTKTEYSDYSRNKHCKLAYYGNHRQPTYSGFELSVTSLRYKLQSNIAELNQLNTSYTGVIVGGVLATTHSKLKASVGIFSSDSSTPYDIDLRQASIVWGFYPLRVKEVRSHTFEPYISIGINYLQSKFYGYYLGNDVTANYSSNNQPFLGQSNWAYASVGGGVEYQMENEDFKFIHPFVNIMYGLPTMKSSASQPFSQTTAQANTSITVGINFGISK